MDADELVRVIPAEQILRKVSGWVKDEDDIRDGPCYREGLKVDRHPKKQQKPEVIPGRKTSNESKHNWNTPLHKRKGKPLPKPRDDSYHGPYVYHTEITTTTNMQRMNERRGHESPTEQSFRKSLAARLVQYKLEQNMEAKARTMLVPKPLIRRLPGVMARRKRTQSVKRGQKNMVEIVEENAKLL